MTIIAILSILIFSPLQQFFHTIQVNILKTQLLHEIAYAQQIARTRKLAIGLCASDNQVNCSSKWEQGHLLFIDDQENGQINNKEQILLVIKNDYPPGVLHFRSYPRYRHYLLFLPLGSMIQDNGTFWYCLPKHHFPSWAIILSQSGRVRIQLPNQQGVIQDEKGKGLFC